jgi:hypothetical protein
MSTIRNSFTTVAEQIINYNRNAVELLSKLNDVVTTSENSVTVSMTDENGVIKTFNLPSIGFLKAEIDRLNNNINTLYSIDAAGAIIQPANNKFKKIITADLNREPTTLNALNTITAFTSNKNWIFDGLLNPMLNVIVDLTGKVEDNVRKCQVRRYIIEFAKDEAGNLTNLGQSALNSFNTLFRGQTNIKIDEFDRWHRTTPGVLNPNDPNYDEQVFDLEPNELLYNGVFSVLRVEQDTLNRKLWYHLDTIDYLVTGTNEIKQLAHGDEVIINVDISTTRYRVVEVSTLSSDYRVRFERVEGLQPIAVGIGTIKIYSPVVFNKKVKISIGYDERNIAFVKPMNADNHLLAKDWSLGTGYWTNDLRLDSSDSNNGKSMEQYYTESVYDYGEVLKDLVAKKIPNQLAGTPPPPTLNIDNFKVIQINKHLTDTPNANLIKTKHNEQKNIKSEVQQISDSIAAKNKQLKVTRFTSDAQRKQFELELNKLETQKDSKVTLQSSLINEILDLTKTTTVGKVQPKFSVRGFWNIPDAVVTRGSRPQEVVQFRVQYKYTTKDGKEPTTETFKLKPVVAGDTTQTGAFSNWNEFKTDARKRTLDPVTGVYTWQIEDVSNADTPNINQLDITISQDERVEIRIKSISEVGWPESPVESDWSTSINIDFPDDLNNILADDQFILKEATQDQLKVNMQSELDARGLSTVLDGITIVGNKTFVSSSDKILSGFKDANGTAIDLYDYLKTLQDRVTGLEEKIKRAKGELVITIFRNNVPFVIKNNSELTFNVECEDYLDSYSDTGVPTGRVYANNVYIIKDFLLKVENKSIESPLGLLSNRNYTTSSDLYNTAAPQVFWVNELNEILSSSTTGQTLAQKNNQFIWSVNYTTIEGTTNVTKLSDNIGNSFTTNNSIVPILASTEYNIGYSETSILNFNNSNASLLETAKWIENTVSVSSTTKLLTSVHPVVQDLDKLVETNSDKVHVIEGGANNTINVPLNIYFKMNSLDPNAGTGNNYKYITLNNATQTVKHIKKLKFFIENESENRPFTFILKFNINRNKVAVHKSFTAMPVSQNIAL